LTISDLSFGLPPFGRVPSFGLRIADLRSQRAKSIWKFWGRPQKLQSGHARRAYSLTTFSYPRSGDKRQTSNHHMLTCLALDAQGSSSVCLFLSKANSSQFVHLHLSKANSPQFLYLHLSKASSYQSVENRPFLQSAIPVRQIQGGI
jgi:hypothetical protein